MYTLVQHSGYVVARKPDFKHAVEYLHLNSTQKINRVRSVGGVLVQSFAEADEMEEAHNYPEGHEGLVPRVLGSFSKKAIDGSPIYIPPTEQEAKCVLTNALDIAEEMLQFAENGEAPPNYKVISWKRELKVARAFSRVH